MGTTKLYIGLKDKDKKTQLVTNEYARQLVIDTVMDYFNGFTIDMVTGVYKHDSGKIIQENTITVTICSSDDLLNVNNLIQDLKIMLNQECIMVEKYASYIKYV